MKLTLDAHCCLAAKRGKALRLMPSGQLMEVRRKLNPVRARCWQLTAEGWRVADLLVAKVMPSGQLMEVRRKPDPVRARCWQLTAEGWRVADLLVAKMRRCR